MNHARTQARKHARSIAVTALAVSMLSAAALAQPLTPAERAAGWQVLFDGSSTSAWRGYRKAMFPEHGWTVERDGSLKVSRGGGDLITKAQYENFELTLDWKASPGANSGIIYRVTEEYGASYQSGPEMQILDDAAHDLAATDSRTAGGLYGLYECAPEKVCHPAGSWNAVRIRVRDGVVTHYMNGVRLLRADMNSSDWKDRVAASKFQGWEGFGVNAVGHLCLQEHGNDVWFRNIRVRDLDAPMPGEIDLLAGNRLDQWTAHLRNDASRDDVFAIGADGVMKDAGRPVGYLRTLATYTNYVLRLQWRFPDGPGNSGVLVRMIGEDKVWPKSVEAQLQSGAAGDFWNIDEFVMTAAPDRTRGRNTKRTHTNERPLGEWNEYEIHVDGGRVALYVNGELLNEATDVEEIAGFICLQAEGVPIEFRRIRLAEISSPRRPGR